MVKRLIIKVAVQGHMARMTNHVEEIPWPSKALDKKSRRVALSSQYQKCFGSEIGIHLARIELATFSV